MTMYWLTTYWLALIGRGHHFYELFFLGGGWFLNVICFGVLQLAFEAHAGQKRRSGEPFIIHPVEVASILGDLVSCKVLMHSSFNKVFILVSISIICLCCDQQLWFTTTFLGVGLGVNCCRFVTWYSWGYECYFWKNREGIRSYRPPHCRRRD